MKYLFLSILCVCLILCQSSANQASLMDQLSSDVHSIISRLNGTHHIPSKFSLSIGDCIQRGSTLCLPCCEETTHALTELTAHRARFDFIKVVVPAGSQVACYMFHAIFPLASPDHQIFVVLEGGSHRTVEKIFQACRMTPYQLGEEPGFSWGLGQIMTPMQKEQQNLEVYEDPDMLSNIGPVETEQGKLSPAPPPMRDYGIGKNVTADNLKDFLQAVADKGPYPNEVISVACTAGVIDFLYNWFCHARRAKCMNAFIHALDEELAAILDQSSPLPHLYRPDSEYTEGIGSSLVVPEFRSPRFNRIVNARLYFVRHVIELGFDVIVSDVDNVFLKDVRKHFRRDVDYEFQRDVSRMTADDLINPMPFNLTKHEPNGGFFRLRSNPKTLAFVDDILRASLAPDFTNQQRDIANTLRKWVASGKAKMVEDGEAGELGPDVMSFRALDPLTFPSGDTFYWRNQAMNAAIKQAPQRSPVMLHATYFTGAQKKRQVFIDLDRWLVPSSEEIIANKTFTCPPGY
eukprot:TRINITY_DN15112_c0_g1::TRINITY_DN15112_c0_g1_i1::g.24985::m.24985 TRINITY_DN15112_c0_g1::TRINITY_DN15112_c0_g1_i1::g.24985  ORF type:complete len:518 (+),score=56.40,sp/Q54RP0/AGTA_DICDI/25.73/1e-08,Nucleotid_trans/PF03407.11/8.6e-26 TRINITY_DN15112_c0_g1_i1:70-1623(+)